MLKSINRYLLLNKPQLWNLRIVNMLALAVLLHLIYFVLGYGSVYSIEYLFDHYNSRFSEQNTEILHFTSGLLIAIIFILWLFRYLRNNPFKSFYPVSRTYLIREFFLVALIILSFVSIYHSYHYGKLIKMRRITEKVDLSKEGDIINLGLAFLPHLIDNYELNRSCLYLDSINSMTDEENNNSNCGGYTENNNIPRYYRFIYYCTESVESGHLNGRQVNDILNRWLRNRQKDSIEFAINQVCKIADQYHIVYNIDAKKCTEFCFNDTINFSIHNIIANRYDNYDYNEQVSISSDEDLHGMIKSTYFMGFSNLIEASDEVYILKSKSFLNVTHIYIYFYFAFGLASLIMLFRILRFKPWIAGILGLGLLAVAGGIIGMSVNDFEDMSIIYILFTFSCFLFSFIFIQKQDSKLVSGVALTWSVVLGAFIIPLIFLNIYVSTEQVGHCLGNRYFITYQAPPIHYWIRNNWDIINWMNISFITLFFVSYVIPMAYKWQANPNE